VIDKKRNANCRNQAITLIDLPSKRMTTGP